MQTECFEKQLAAFLLHMYVGGFELLAETRGAQPAQVCLIGRHPLCDSIDVSTLTQRRCDATFSKFETNSNPCSSLYKRALA